MERAAHLLELVGEGRRHGVRGLQQRDADVVPVADHHGHGHGLPERPAEAEDDRADDAGLAVRQHRGPHRLPAGGAQREGRLALGVRHRPQHLPGDGADIRQDHDRQNDGCGEERVPLEPPTEEGCPAQNRPERGDDVVPQQRDQHEDAPQAVHDARNGCEQLHQRGHRRAQPLGGELRQINGYTEGQRDGDEQCQKR